MKYYQFPQQLQWYRDFHLKSREEDTNYVEKVLENATYIEILAIQNELRQSTFTIEIEEVLHSNNITAGIIAGSLVCCLLIVITVLTFLKLRNKRNLRVAERPEDNSQVEVDLVAADPVQIENADVVLDIPLEPHEQPMWQAANQVPRFAAGRVDEYKRLIPAVNFKAGHPTIDRYKTKECVVCI